MTRLTLRRLRAIEAALLKRVVDLTWMTAMDNGQPPQGLHEKVIRKAMEK